MDEEREMWLNSFYKAPLRLPMPAELEHWWSKGMILLVILYHLAGNVMGNFAADVCSLLLNSQPSAVNIIEKHL